MAPTDRWVKIPDDALPGQYRKNDWLRMPDGSVVKILARSTQMLRVRRVPAWRVFLRRRFGR